MKITFNSIMKYTNKSSNRLTNIENITNKIQKTRTNKNQT